MFVESALQGVENAAQGMRQIEELSDADVAEVHESQSLFHAVESATANLRGFLNTLAGLRWLTAGLKVRQRATFEAPLAETLGADPTQAFTLLSQGAGSSSPVGVPLVGTHSPSAPTVRGEPGRSPSQARVEPHPPDAAPNPEPPSSPSNVGAASPTRPSSDPDLDDSEGHDVGSMSSGSRQSSPLQGERQIRASSPEIGEGSSAQPTPNQPTAKSTDPAFTTLLNQSQSIANEESFLHWEAAFPGVWRHWQNHTPEGGFDAVIGNPPWDRIKLQEVEWFATRDPDLARAPTAAARRAGIKRLREQGDPLAEAFDQAKARADRLGQVIRASGHYPLLGGGDINLYSLFVERSLRLVKPNGLVGLLTPSGIYADRTAARFFQSVSTTGRVAGIYDFENRRLGTDLPPFFPDIDSRFKFCALVVGGSQRTFPETRCGFFLSGADAITDPDRAFTLTPDDFARVNPNTGTAPVFRIRRDADLTRRIYRDHPVLVDRSGDDERRVWPVRYYTMFHMTNDSHLFRTAAQLEDEGFYPVQGNRWKRGKDLCLPLYEGKMVQAFDHRAASVVVNPENLNRPARPRQTTLEERSDPSHLPDPQFWVNENRIEWPEGLGWAIGFKDVTAPTNVRTMIAAIVPHSGVGNTLPLVIPDADDDGSYKDNACLWLACLNSLAFDFVARQKVQGQHLNWFVVEQLPVLSSDAYHRRFGDRTATDLIRHHVLRLTYTSHDMAPFARDLGHHGPPFPGTPNTAATYEPASTPSTSTSTTSTATTPPTSSPPSPSSNARTRPNSTAATAPKTLSLPT
ncbi:MAG: hypothetical protein OXR64_12055 [Chloroflexota bacterium]|nr:hypothetical protein [Chloroflexota bacterium]MDE2920558.1 hypothetical protein [Chloroflexota bacterium]